MAKKKYEEANIQAIADTIREKTGTDNTYDTSEMASGVNEVYEAGKKAEYDNFWSNFAARNGNEYLFAGSGWHSKNFYPNFEFSISERTFYKHNWFNQNGSGYDLAKRFEDLGLFKSGVKISNPSYSFCYAHFSRLPKIDMSTVTSNCTSTFYDMRRLITIDELIFGENITGFTNSFYRCEKLKNIKASGVISVSISFSASPLTIESMKSIISTLKDYTGTEKEFTYTLTLYSDCETALTDEGATAEYNGESCTWVELIDNKKWNLVWA